MASTRPPGEGARWGNDIQQTPQPPTTAPATAYAELCDEYGEANVQKALQVREKIKNDYPHLSVIKLAPLEFAGGILRSARNSVQKAAADGRPHTMPETLKIMENILGNHYAGNPTHGTTVNITYGDEKQGKTAQKEKANALLIISAGVVAFGLTWLITKELGAAVFVALLAFGVTRGIVERKKS